MTKLSLGVGAVLYLAMIVLGLRPAFDLDVESLFYRGSNSFVGATPIGVAMRYVAWCTPFAIFFAMVLMAALRRLGAVPARWGPTGRSVLFLAFTLAVGPGIIVHAALKNVSHRPRPVSVTRFGGSEAFRPWYRFDGACRFNCSFPSGETAAASWTLAPASLAPPPLRAALLGGALAFAAFAGGWRMALGAHFLSDVVGAALITIVVVALSRRLLPRVPAALPPASRDPKSRAPVLHQPDERSETEA